MSSALFGPDGTQPPVPDDVLSDPLVGPAAADGWAAPASGALPPLPPLPPLPDIDAIRRSLLEEEQFLPTPPEGFPAQPAVPPPHVDLPPHGFPLSQHDSTAPQPGLPLPPQGFAAPPPGFPVPPPGFHAPPGLHAPPPGFHGPQGQRVPPPLAADRLNPYDQRRRKEPRNPLIQKRRRGSGGWIGCVVVLVFLVAIAFNLVQALVAVVLDLVG